MATALTSSHASHFSPAFKVRQMDKLGEVCSDHQADGSERYELSQFERGFVVAAFAIALFGIINVTAHNGQSIKEHGVSVEMRQP